MPGVFKEGKISLTGPVTDDAGIRRIEIYDLSDVEEVTKLADYNSAVRAGRLIYEIQPWFGLPGDALPQYDGMLKRIRYDDRGVDSHEV